MKIENHFVEEMTIEDFADKHNLTMSVHERSKIFNLPKFYAHFKDIEISKGMMLYSISGDGSTPEEAIVNYTSQISEQRLVTNAMRSSRKEILAPRFIQSEHIDEH